MCTLFLRIYKDAAFLFLFLLKPETPAASLSLQQHPQLHLGLCLLTKGLLFSLGPCV